VPGGRAASIELWGDCKQVLAYLFVRVSLCAGMSGPRHMGNIFWEQDLQLLKDCIEIQFMAMNVCDIEL
jgi:hypothetical protein